MPKAVRNLISAREARELLKQIETWDGEPKAQWKARAEAHETVIQKGDPFEYAKVAKELSRMSYAVELRPRDKRNLARSLSLLTEELTQALKRKPSQASELIERALQK